MFRDYLIMKLLQFFFVYGYKDIKHKNNNEIIIKLNLFLNIRKLCAFMQIADVNVIPLKKK